MAIHCCHTAATLLPYCYHTAAIHAATCGHMRLCDAKIDWPRRAVSCPVVQRHTWRNLKRSVCSLWLEAFEPSLQNLRVTRTSETRLQTSFLQVPRVRRRATQRNYTTDYYTPSFQHFWKIQSCDLFFWVDTAGSRRKSRAGASIPQKFLRAARGLKYIV